MMEILLLKISDSQSVENLSYDFQIIIPKNSVNGFNLTDLKILQFPLIEILNKRLSSCLPFM